MWVTWIKTSIAALLAFAALACLAAVWHDQPYVYPATVRSRWITLTARATPRHVAVGGWWTPDHDLLGTELPYWDGLRLDVYTQTLDRLGERGQTNALFATARHSVRLGEFGMLHGAAVPPVSSYSELLLPTWLAVAAGVCPVVIVLIGRVRRALHGTPGHCRVCGYDLRATPGRCPECGAEPRAAPAAA